MNNKEDFIQRCLFWMDKGGRWRSINRAFKPGEMQPEAFEYHAEEGPSASVMGFTIYGFGQGQKFLMWKGFHYWNEIKNKSEYLSLGANDEVCTGETYDELDMYFIIVMASGQVMHILNHDDIINENEIRSTAKSLVDGDWQEMSVLEWKRIS